jgi:hypothetical protein
MAAGLAIHQKAGAHRARESPPDGNGTNGTPREEGGSRQQQEEGPQNVSRRVASHLSSTRAELEVTKPQNNCTTEWSMLHELS